MSVLCSLIVYVSLIRSSYVFNCPTTSSNPTVLRSRTCSINATMYMNHLGSIVRNLLTSLVSLIVSLREAYFDDILDNWLAKSFMVLVSFIFILSKSFIRVWSQASFTLSALTCHVLITSHISFAVSIAPTCNMRSSGIA